MFYTLKITVLDSVLFLHFTNTLSSVGLNFCQAYLSNIYSAEADTDHPNAGFDPTN